MLFISLEQNYGFIVERISKMDAPAFENIVTSSQNSSPGVLLHLPEPSTSHLDI